MPTPIHGHLDPVGRLKCHEVLADQRDPAGRYFLIRRGLTLIVIDTAPDTPVEVCAFRSVAGEHRRAAIHPDGRTIAVRDLRRHTLALFSPEAVIERVSTETAALSWDGEPANPKAPAPRGGFADEHLMFSADGAQVLLATHAAAGGACVMVFDAADLTLRQTFTDLPCHSPYATLENAGVPPQMGWWSESWLAPDRLDPSVILGVRNAGDSALGVFALRLVGGRLEGIDPAGLSKAVFAVDTACLGAVRRLPAGLLVVDRDATLARLPWPPGPKPRVLAQRNAEAELGDEAGDLTLPFEAPHPPGLRASDLVTVTADHVLVELEASGYTVALAAFDPASMALLGVVARPQSRARFDMLIHLGNDLFAGAGRTSAALWRLRRGPAE